MTDETRTPTARVVVTFYDREIIIEGDNLGSLKNSSMKRLEISLKREVKRARRVAIRAARVVPTSDPAPIKDGELKVKPSVTPKKPALVDSLQKLGIKLNKSEGVESA